MFTNIVSFVKDHHCFLGEFFRDLFSNLRVQQVVIAVHHDVGMVYLTTQTDNQ
jgi:hypothetical protein